MANKTTIAWRIGVLGLLATVVPAGIYWYDQQRQVDTQTMLDVSVSIRTISHVRIDAVGDSVWEPATGSGFLVSSERCEVLTNHHVIANAAVIEVYPRQWQDTSGIPASVVNSSPRSDIAILRMQRCDGLPHAKLGDSDTLRAGDEVYAVGNPLGLNPDSISRGIISHTQRYAKGALPYLQTDATINRGNSGGALFNRRGEVIGVNTAIVSNKNGTNTGIGYALPINLVKSETKILHAGPPSWGDAGLTDLVSPLTPDEAAVFRVPDGHAALVVMKTPKEGPSADKLLARDVIYQIDDTAVINASQATQLISSKDPGDTVTLHVIRDGDVMPIAIVLADGWKVGEAPAAEYYKGYLGMTLEMWTNKEDEPGHFDSPVITKVQSLGPAHMAYIVSSQKTVARAGPLVFPVQLDVKTVTGAVYSGTYYRISKIEELNELAAKAFATDSSLLLEIEIWGRSNPMNLDQPLERRDALFRKVTPAVSTAAEPEPAVMASSKDPQESDRVSASAVAHFEGPPNR